MLLIVRTASRSRGAALAFALVLAVPLQGAGCRPPEAVPCATDADCGAQICLAGGTCGDPQLDGAACARDVECASGRCFTEPQICGTPCDDEGDCAPGLSCAVARDDAGGAEALLTACIPTTGTGAPGAACFGDDDCETGLCDASLCVERCGDCPAGEACEPATLDRGGETIDLGLCRWRFPSPALELGPVVTNVDGSGELLFDVPAGVISITVVVIDEDELIVSVRTLTAPDGTVLVDVTDGMPDLNPAASYFGVSSLMVPDTDDVAANPQEGTYRLSVGTYDPANEVSLDPVAGDVERVAVIFERAGEQGGLLDLVLHFSPATGIASASALEDAYVIELIATLSSMLGGLASIRVADVTVGPDLDAGHDVVEDGDEARALCRDSSLPGRRGAGLNLFLVEDLGFTYGLAGGIPTPPGINGTSGSGIVAELLGSGTDTAILLAHEIGHTLGLWHTTNPSGTGDPISDTPVCGAGVIIQDCPDYMNVMFPIFPLSTGVILSAGQVGVLRRAALLYEVVRPAACPTTSGAVDVTGSGFATGDTTGLVAAGLSGSCGGGGAPERMQLYRLATEGLSALEVRVVGLDFAPAVYVRVGLDCADAAAEVACTTADGGVEALVSVASPIVGPYFIAVDGRDGLGGTFTVEVTEVP